MQFCRPLTADGFCFALFLLQKAADSELIFVLFFRPLPIDFFACA